MSLTRRRLFQRLATPEPTAQAEWIAARGREAGMNEYGEQAMAAGAMPIRIASNENPLGPGPARARRHRRQVSRGAPLSVQRPADRGRAHHRARQKFEAKNENLLLGPGSGEILTHAVRAFTSASRPLVTAWPSFENPRDTAKKLGVPVKEVALDSKLRIDLAKMVEASKGAGLVFFCNPNNPTATVHGRTSVADLIKEIRAASPDTMILVDEAYHDYVTDPSYQTVVDLALATPNVFVTRTFSKAYGMAGLRAGYAIGHAPTIKAIQAYRMPYGLGDCRPCGAAIASLGNQAHIDAERKRNTDVKAFTMKAFADMGFPAPTRRPISSSWTSSGPPPGSATPAAPPVCWWDGTSRPTRRPTAASPSARWPRCRRPSTCSSGCSAPRRPRQARNGGDAMSRVKEVSAMSLSRRSFVQTLGVGAAGVWIAARGREASLRSRRGFSPRRARRRRSSCRATRTRSAATRTCWRPSAPPSRRPAATEFPDRGGDGAAGQEARREA